MKIAIHCCFLLSLTFTVPAFSQTAAVDQSPMDSLISSETMHVHFDKDIYLPGETIWFKAYLYNVHEPSFISTNFYVAIYDEKGKLLQQKQYPVFEGSCNGDFEIPDTIQIDRIRFRAFTRAMIINDSNNVYEKVLTVYNKENNTGGVTVNNTKDLRFFPEGGQMVAELENHLAFKATYADGSPAMINGQIVEVERNRIVDTFFTGRSGLGKLVMIPSPGKSYMALWKDENGIKEQTHLPTINRYGVSFHTEIINKELQYTIVRNTTRENLNSLHLMAQMGNYRVYKADLVIPNEMELAIAKFSIDSLPAGLMQLTLFDKDWKPLQERLVFISDSAILQQPLVITDTVNTNPKGKNVIEIALPDTMFTNLSASIADINFYNQPGIHSINQDLWFNTQLKELNTNTGTILRSGNSSAIDLVILTHGWKRYNWQKAIDKSSVKPEFLDNYISLSVNYKEKNNALPKEDALNLIINNKGMGKQFYTLQPIDQTTFKKADLVFFDSVKVSYQMNKNKDLANYLTISRDNTLTTPSYIDALESRPRFAGIKTTATFNEVETFYTPPHKKFNDVQTIRQVVVRSKYRGNPILERTDELDKFYTTGMFSGTVRGYQLNVIDDPQAKMHTDIANYIGYRWPRIKVWVPPGSTDKYFVAEESVTVGKKQLSPVPLFLDEMQIEHLEDIDMANVVYVKYIPGIVIGGTFRSLIGAIYVYTKKGNEKEPSSDNMKSVYIKGYNSQKEFISMDYSDSSMLKDTDLRTTLYWNPNVIMDKTNNKVRIEYYHNDVSKKLLLTIEGVNAVGKLIHIEKMIE